MYLKLILQLISLFSSIAIVSSWNFQCISNLLPLKKQIQDTLSSHKLASRFMLSSLILLNTPFQCTAEELMISPWNSGIKYEVLKSNPNGEFPKIGDLVTIRFKGAYKNAVFDDTFSTEEPYFYRCGVGIIVKGLDDTVVHMRSGEKYHVQFGGELAFPNGRPSAPGRPRILPNADVDYEV